MSHCCEIKGGGQYHCVKISTKKCPNQENLEDEKTPIRVLTEKGNSERAIDLKSAKQLSTTTNRSKTTMDRLNYIGTDAGNDFRPPEMTGC